MVALLLQREGCKPLVTGRLSNALAMLLLAAAVAAAAAAAGDVYMVLLEGDPVSRYSGSLPQFEATACSLGTKFDKSRSSVQLYTSHLVHRHDSLLKETLTDGSYTKLYSYHHLVNGFAAHITPQQADLLANAPGVALVQKSWQVQKLTTHTPDFLGLPRGAWAQQGGAANAGEGIVIGNVDTGIDPAHPSFSGQGYGPVQGYSGSCEEPRFCNGKIVGAQHFAAAAKASGTFNSSVDDDSPLDTDGHGSHTASIAAGNYGVPVVIDGHSYGKASGMAPRARIAVYKALYQQSGSVADAVAAIDKAAEDGVDVLNLSVGPKGPPASGFLNVFDMALLAAVKRGVFVTQAAGNGGPDPRTVVSFSPWIATVAAGVDDRSYPNYISLGNNNVIPGLGLAPPSPAGMSNLILSEDAVVNSTNYFFSPNECLDPSLFNRDAVKDKILICTYTFSFIYDGASLSQVAATVANLSAVGFVLLVESDLAGSKFEPVPISVPSIVITTLAASEELLRYYNTSTTRDAKGKAIHFNATAKIGNGQEAVYNRSAPRVASYSARGPDVRDTDFQDADVLKPNIMAPGSLIWGAWTPKGSDSPNFEGKNFALISGTSMATPHVAGIAALLKAKFPGKTPAAIASAMMTTASPLDKHGSPLLADHAISAGERILGPATPFDYGHGAIDPTAALDPGLVFDADYDDYINFLCAVPGVRAKLVTNSSFSCPKNTSNSSRNSSSNSSRVLLMSDLNLPSITIANLVGERRVPRKVTSISNISETYTFSFSEPPGVTVRVSPASFTIKPGESVPFLVVLKATASRSEFGFGGLRLLGDGGHVVRVPVSIQKAQLQ